jgi:phage terminase small subunit
MRRGAGVEMLTQYCQAVDLAEALSARIAEDGEIIRTMNGIKAHPAIKDGLAARGFVVRTLQKLGLNFEPLRTAPGRPPGS